MFSPVSAMIGKPVFSLGGSLVHAAPDVTADFARGPVSVLAQPIKILSGLWRGTLESGLSVNPDFVPDVADHFHASTVQFALIDPISIGVALLLAGAVVAAVSPRLRNLFKGKASLEMGKLEKNNPEAVFQAAIDNKEKEYKKLKEAVAGIVVLRNETKETIDVKKKKLAEVEAHLATAVDQGADDVALGLIQSKEELTSAIAELERSLTQYTREAEEAKATLAKFQASIDVLKREMGSSLAQLASAQARIAIQNQMGRLSSISTTAEDKALSRVREHVAKLGAEADIDQEMGDVSMDAKLQKIKAATATRSAQGQLEALKRVRDAKMAENQSIAAGGAAVKKQL